MGDEVRVAGQCDEVGVEVQDRRTGSDCHRGNQAVDESANRFTVVAARSI